MSFIDSSVRADGAVILTGLTEYETCYGSNEVSIEWEAVLKNNVIAGIDARVINGWEMVPLTVVEYEIMTWVNANRSV